MTQAGQQQRAKPRAREAGVPLHGNPGPYNALTDVPRVEVGVTTLVEGDAVRTGVTAVLPRGRAEFDVPCAAAVHSLNGNGEMTGSAWLNETGSLTLPVLITNTHAVGPCHRGTVEWAARERPGGDKWRLPVVAETWDGWLNDINADTVRSEHAVAAIDAARGGPVPEGSVGGGTGMNCYAFKGGTGTSSRVVPYGQDSWTVGALVQANFGSRRELTVAGVPLGRELADDNPMEEPAASAPPGAGSVIVVIGTDAPLLPGQCAALARRVPLGLARTGTTGSHFSGDIFLAFSTANPSALSSEFPGTGGEAEAVYEELRFIPWGRLDPFFEAVVQAVEEAVLNALWVNAAMTGRAGHRTPALPTERAAGLLARRG